MTRDEVRDRIVGIEGSFISIAGLDQELERELLDEYSVNAWALKAIGDEWIWEQAIRVQEICDTIESRIPKISEEVMNEYVAYNILLAICLYEVPCLQVEDG